MPQGKSVPEAEQHDHGRPGETQSCGLRLQGAAGSNIGVERDPEGERKGRRYYEDGADRKKIRIVLAAECDAVHRCRRHEKDDRKADATQSHRMRGPGYGWKLG